MARRASFHDPSQSPRAVVMGSPRFERKKRSYSLEIRNWQNQNQSSLGLQLSDIITLLNDVIPTFCKDRELTLQSRVHCQRILATTATDMGDSRQLSGKELEDVVSVLDAFLNSAPALPPALVGLVHSTIGLIRSRQRFFDCAIESLQKALWIKNSARERPDEIGLALHRLGMAYGRQGDRLQSNCLLQKALVKYDEAGWGKYHPCVLSAKERIERYQESTSPSPGASSSRRSSTNSPARRRNDLKTAVKDWRSLPAMPVLR